MNPDEIQVAPANTADEGLTSGDLASIAVDPSQAPPVQTSALEGSGPLGALVAFAVLVAGVGKKIQTFMVASHEARMKAIEVSKEVIEGASQTESILKKEIGALMEVKNDLEGKLAEAKAPPTEAASAPATEDAPAEPTCTCAENQAALEDLTKRLKALESWKKRAGKPAPAPTKTAPAPAPAPAVAAPAKPATPVLQPIPVGGVRPV